MNDYFKNLFEKFESLNDEEFKQLLLDSGIERCPYDMTMFSASKNKSFKEVYGIQVDTANINDKKLREYEERKKIA